MNKYNLLNNKEYTNALALLNETDYKAIKHSEGLISDIDYLPIKQMREEARQTIRRIEEEMKGL